ncbi:MAG: BtrH N-terminal domain-containing protein [Myxococcota bacterium]
MPIVEGYAHRTGEHCASTALRNLMAFRGTELSEGMVFGLASGLGFYYLEADGISPTRMFHGRTATLESDFGSNTGIGMVDRPEDDDARAWQLLREHIDHGEPVMLSTDTFYLGYHNTTSHFPGHRCVVVGYDDETEEVWIADRKYDTYQRCGYEELRAARNARDYPISCQNQWGDFRDAKPLTDLPGAIRRALRKNAHAMLDPHEALPAGIPAMRRLARALPDWSDATDWSWAARFGYQIILKRGAAGSFFRALYFEFLREAEGFCPGLGEHGLVPAIETIVTQWQELAVPLKEQSERETCDPGLFREAGAQVARLADAEQAFFERVLRATAA